MSWSPCSFEGRVHSALSPHWVTLQHETAAHQTDVYLVTQWKLTPFRTGGAISGKTGRRLRNSWGFDWWVRRLTCSETPRDRCDTAGRYCVVIFHWTQDNKKRWQKKPSKGQRGPDGIHVNTLCHRGLFVDYLLNFRALKTSLGLAVWPILPHKGVSLYHRHAVGWMGLHRKLNLTTAAFQTPPWNLCIPWPTLHNDMVCCFSWHYYTCASRHQPQLQQRPKWHFMTHLAGSLWLFVLAFV